MFKHNMIPAGTYEVVIAHAEDAISRADNYFRRLNLVVVGPAGGHVGTVLFAYMVDSDNARWVWEDACESPADLDVGQHYLADLTQDLGPDENPLMRVRKLRLIPGAEVPPPRDRPKALRRARRLMEEARAWPEPVEEGCEQCNGGIGEDPHAEDCPADRSRRRRSAVEREQDRIHETIDTYLFETAEPGPVTDPQPYANARMGTMGVVFPDSGIEGGAILEPGYCIRLGAQLIRAGRMVDEFAEVIQSRRGW